MKHITLIAGEASGDHHGAALVTDLKQLDSQLKFSGIGGVLMQNAGVPLLANLAQYGVVGGTEVLQHARVIYQAWKLITRFLQEQKPDLLILIDYPGFNLRLARYAKKLNIKVLYYISPQIWAWKKHRINTIRENVTHMAVILPFETEIYRQAQVPVTYVGHPLLHSVVAKIPATEARSLFGLKANSRVIALLPGSRKKEIKKMLPIMIQAAEKLKAQYSDLEFILPLASSLTQEDLKSYLAETSLVIKIVEGQTYEVLNCSTAAMVTSGTATLETALLDVPMVILYKMSAITFALAKRIIKVNYIGLCNLLIDKSVVPELIQSQATPQRVTEEIQRYLDCDSERQKTIQQLQEVRNLLERSGQEDTIAKVALKLL